MKRKDQCQAENEPKDRSGQSCDSIQLRLPGGPDLGSGAQVTYMQIQFTQVRIRRSKQWVHAWARCKNRPALKKSGVTSRVSNETYAIEMSQDLGPAADVPRTKAAVRRQNSSQHSSRDKGRFAPGRFFTSPLAERGRRGPPSRFPGSTCRHRRAVGGWLR